MQKKTTVVFIVTIIVFGLVAGAMAIENGQPCSSKKGVETTYSDCLKACEGLGVIDTSTSIVDKSTALSHYDLAAQKVKKLNSGETVAQCKARCKKDGTKSPSATPTPTITTTPTPTAPSQIITYTSRQFLVGKPIDPYEKCLNNAKFYKLQTGKEYPVDCTQYKTSGGDSTTGGSSSSSGTPLMTTSLGVKTGGTSLTMGSTVSGGSTGTSSGFGASLVSSSSFKSGSLGVQSGSMMSSAGTYSGSTSFTSLM